MFHTFCFKGMELLVKGKHSNVLFKNAFQNMNELCLARTQWSSRVGVEECVREFIQQRTVRKHYFGVTMSKSNLSIVHVNHQGRRSQKCMTV